MRPLHPGRAKSPSPGVYRVFRVAPDERADQVRLIASLINTWLESRDGSRPGSISARGDERNLHLAIKASPLYGKILSFAGLNLWVDERTSDGLVMSQECLNL